MGIRAAAAVLLAIAPHAIGIASAQERFKLQYNHVGQSSKYLAQQAYDVGDQPGHQVRIYKVQRTYSEESTLVIRGVRVKSSEANGYSDYTNGIGPIWGYEVWTMEDGGKVFLTYTGSTFSEPTETGSRRGIATSATRITGGTGAWKSLRGMMHSASKFDSDPQKGYSQADNKGEYWFDE
jgi:hypothetical protein